MFTTETPNYMLFIHNWEELDNVTNKMNSEVKFNEENTIYNKNHGKV